MFFFSIHPILNIVAKSLFAQLLSLPLLTHLSLFLSLSPYLYSPVCCNFSFAVEISVFLLKSCIQLIIVN